MVSVLPSRVTALTSIVLREIFSHVFNAVVINSAMDGYAVVSSDCGQGAILRVVGEQAAGIDQKKPNLRRERRSHFAWAIRTARMQ
jgi:molybdopterin biosynthesis enzyme